MNICEFIQNQYPGTVKLLFQCSKLSAALTLVKEIDKSGSAVESYRYFLITCRHYIRMDRIVSPVHVSIHDDVFFLHDKLPRSTRLWRLTTSGNLSHLPDLHAYRAGKRRHDDLT
ncbi:hypothetical protein CLOSCI_02973, partial [[Clostridium] scindens ATCC 35704]